MKGAADPAVRRASPASSTTRSLRRLRLRLTAWYVGTFAAVMVALGALLFAGLVHGVSADLESSLREATQGIANAADNARDAGQSPTSETIDAVRKFQLRGRKLYLFDTQGNLLVPGNADNTLRALARRAAANSFATSRWEANGDQTLQAYAERFVTRGGKTFVAAAVVDRDLIDDQYATLVALVGGLGVLGLVLVAAGGWILARQSIVPVEHSMEQMRRFIADAAHELRTPVAVIRSRVDVTLEQPREAAAYEHALTELRGEVERLSLLINDLFMLARADAGERAVVSARVQLD
ncbi:MAG: histidine kinase dimerization/phospho-acceptor domain-containing protein, partial [Gemmatimonadaceae bacterium]